MITILLTLLVLVDVVLLGVVYYLGKNRITPLDILREINDERQLLKELQLSVKEEMESGERRCRDVLGKITAVATEVDLGLKENGENLNKEVEQIIAKISSDIQDPLKVISKRQASLEMLLKKVDNEKLLLKKAITKAERLAMFFDKNLPYEEVLRDIEDKKYTDARELITKGFAPSQIAKELNLPQKEVDLLVSLG